VLNKKNPKEKPVKTDILEAISRLNSDVKDLKIDDIDIDMLEDGRIMIKPKAGTKLYMDEVPGTYKIDLQVFVAKQHLGVIDNDGN